MSVWRSSARSGSCWQEESRHDEPHNVVLAGLVATVFALSALVRVDYSQPNVEVLPDMKYTSAWSAYDRNPNFSNGRTLQAPVAGTIARGNLPIHYSATKEDAAVAGDELRNPFASAVNAEHPSTDEAEKERLKPSVQDAAARSFKCFASHATVRRRPATAPFHNVDFRHLLRCSPANRGR